MDNTTDTKTTILHLLAQKYPPLLTQAQLREITGHSDSFLEQARLKGGFVGFVRIGRSIRYPLDAVADYLASLPRYNSTAEADSGVGRAA